MDTNIIIILIISNILSIGFIVLLFILKYKKTQKVKNTINELANNSLEISPEEFFKIRNTYNGKKHISTDYDFTGVYILFNSSKNKYYVGQAKRIFQRVNNHFTGHGNGDVYADYKYGDSFTIKMIKLENSGFNSLNELERKTILVYDAFSKGYNKTRGNR